MADTDFFSIVKTGKEKDNVPEEVNSKTEEESKENSGLDNEVFYDDEATANTNSQPMKPAYAPTERVEGEGGPGVWHTEQSAPGVTDQPIVRPRPVVMLKQDHSELMVCFNCGATEMSYIYYEAGTATYACCISLALIGCDLGCCFIPFCVDRFKDIIHKCPKCHIVVGRHKRC